MLGDLALVIRKMPKFELLELIQISECNVAEQLLEGGLPRSFAK